MHNPQYYRQLVDRYLEKKLTDEELEVFIHLLQENKLDEYMLAAMNKDAGLTEFDDEDYSRSVKVISFGYRLAAAAVLFFVLGFGVYFYKSYQLDNTSHTSAHNFSEIGPGGNKAILTLSNGKKLVLNDQKSGELAKQSAISITKAEDGLLIYTAAESAARNENISIDKIPFNTVETPKGGQYQVILPDGTKAWLNAASRIRFPVMFAGNERRVHISGEVYFEVEKNAEMPFRVVSSGQVIEVLGTHFNVNAYPDDVESVTTLLEGSIKLLYKGKNQILTPGQEGRIGKGGDIDVSVANTEEAIAWKKGYFMFDRDNIQEVMKKLSRWYDIEVKFEGEIPQDELVGKIRSSVSLSQALKMLKLSKLHFDIVGKKITVKKQ